VRGAVVVQRRSRTARNARCVQPSCGSDAVCRQPRKDGRNPNLPGRDMRTFPAAGRKWLTRLLPTTIHGQLLLAFAFFAGLTCLALAVAFLALSGIASSLLRIINTALPSLASVQEVSQQAARFAEHAPALYAVDTQQRRAQETA